ncbi:MAG TPA: 2-dehydro-3-deoxygluconokinase [Cytophagales bacterium]|nr:2-dehydro-3-deoxygluconokinase [Cytophagales bacterium]
MKIVTFGELLLRFCPPGHLRFSQAGSYEVSVGGAEANVAMSLAQFGDQVSYVSAIPNNDLGFTALREVNKWGVNTDHVKVGGDKMGLYFLEKGASLRGGNIIYDRAGSAFSEVNADTYNWEEILEGADWFHWTGITPAVSAGAAEATARAIKIARERKIPVSCDLNYRSKLWKYGLEPKEVMPGLIQNTNIVLANEEDVAKYLGIVPQESNYEELEGFGKRSYSFISRMVHARFPHMHSVITTLRQTINASHNRWSGVVYNGTEFFHGQVHDISAIVDRVGGGDAFMAAFIHAKLKYRDLEKALNFGLAAAALKLSIPGDYNVVTEAEVDQLVGKQGVSMLSR